MQGTASTAGLQTGNTEDPLHIHRLFIRSQLHPAIDYHTEIQQIIFLTHGFLFLYDNHLYLGRYYDHYQQPQLVLEQRIVSMCLINEAQGQVLVCYEAGGFYFLVFPSDPHTNMISPSYHTLSSNQQGESIYSQANVQEERLSFPLDISFALYYEQFIQNHSNQSPLQENYSIKLDYFPEHNMIIVGMHSLLRDVMQLPLQSQVVEVVVDEQGCLAGKCIKSIDRNYVHNQSIHTIWSANDQEEEQKVQYVASACNDNVIYLFPLSYSLDYVEPVVDAVLEPTLEPLHPSSHLDYSQSISDEDRFDQEQSQEVQQTHIQAVDQQGEQQLEKEEENDRGEKEEDDEGDEEDDEEDDEKDQAKPHQEEEIKFEQPSKVVHPPATPAHVKAGAILMKTKHKAWITTLSSSMYSHHHYPKLPINQRKGSYYTMSGDKLGGLALYLYHKDIAVTKTPWKICDYRNSITSQQAISEIIIHYQSNQVIKAYVGDQAGRISILNISEKTNKMHIVQEMALFSTFGSVTQMSILPIITSRSNDIDDDQDQASIRSFVIEDTFRLRCYSHDAGEAVECYVSKQMASIMKIWPESTLQNPQSRFYPHVSLDKSLYQTHNLIQTSFILSDYNVLFVCDFTKHLHVYDIVSSCLLLSILMPSDHCTCLLAHPEVHDQSVDALAESTGFKTNTGKAITLVSGHKDGHIHVYHIRFPPKKKPPTADENNPGYLDSIAMGSSKSSNYHLTHPTVFSEDITKDMDLSVAKSLEDQSTTSFEDSEYEEESLGNNDNGVLDLLNNADDGKDADSLQSSLNPSIYLYDEDSQVLHMKHHHHHYQPRTPDVRAASAPFANTSTDEPFFEGIRYEIAQSMHLCPLQVTDLFFSTHAQYLVSIHLKRYLHVFLNQHFAAPASPVDKYEGMEETKKEVDAVTTEEKSSPGKTVESGDKVKTEAIENKEEEETDSKKKEKGKPPKPTDGSTNKLKPSLTSKGKTTAMNAKDIKPVDISKTKEHGTSINKKAATTSLGNSKKVTISVPVAENEGTKETKAESTSIPKQRYTLSRQMKFDEGCQSITMLQCIDGILENEEDLPSFDQERLILIITPLVSNEMKILNAIDLKFILSIPLPTMQVGKSFPGQEKYKNLVRSCMVWDYTLPNTKERPLIGLCNTINPDQYIAFDESNGFQSIVDQDHQALVTKESHLNSFSMYHHTWQRDLMIGMQGFTSNHSPIMVTWSNYHCILLRLQLHAERGPLIMRSKHYHTHNDAMYLSPQMSRHGSDGSNLASSTVNSPNSARVVTAKALKHVSYIRNHRVLVVLSTGYAIILHL